MRLVSTYTAFHDEKENIRISISKILSHKSNFESIETRNPTYPSTSLPDSVADDASGRNVLVKYSNLTFSNDNVDNLTAAITFRFFNYADAHDAALPIKNSKLSNSKVSTSDDAALPIKNSKPSNSKLSTSDDAALPVKNSNRNTYPTFLNGANAFYDTAVASNPTFYSRFSKNANVAGAIKDMFPIENTQPPNARSSAFDDA
eukprot:CAMPEP_0171307212 /NCGR_PEP_ID=MMETSP0816-20121228/17224_1 /TAXON_ID=420281 /ORGANISM="Proboscia inermis, Strain CCAP1064/1" /LENGTH=202 /DNA_ID=CAMNT_0011789239 /DNA_START=338 /DNA_END=942 /DNA_ORIENTATION=-